MNNTTLETLKSVLETATEKTVITDVNLKMPIKTKIVHNPKLNDTMDSNNTETWVATATYQNSTGEIKKHSVTSTRSSINAMTELKNNFPSQATYEHEDFDELDENR